MPNIDTDDRPPTPSLEAPLPPPPALRSRTEVLRTSTLARERTAWDVLDEALRTPLDVLDEALRPLPPHGPRVLAHDARARSFSDTAGRELPDLAARIDEAQRQARARRVAQGLPPDPDDGAYALIRPRKHAPKRGKKHGQFLGSACDSREEDTRTRR